MKKALAMGWLVASGMAWNATVATPIWAQNPAAPEQAPVPAMWAVGQKVEVEEVPGSKKWLPATIVEVLNDGYSYKVRLVPEGGSKSVETIIHFKRVRAASAKPQPSRKKPNATSNAVVFGKYGCTASQYSGANVQYIGRGSFVLSKSGQYTYYGFKTPSKGRFTVDKTGNLFFKGGYFNGGKAEKIDRPNKFFLTFPTNPDNRWTCSLIQKSSN